MLTSPMTQIRTQTRRGKSAGSGALPRRIMNDPSMDIDRSPPRGYDIHGKHDGNIDFYGEK
eukprot:scaffold13467_cov81-Skeletonema_menzelii.AAC.1